MQLGVDIDVSYCNHLLLIDLETNQSCCIITKIVRRMAGKESSKGGQEIRRQKHAAESDFDCP